MSHLRLFVLHCSFCILLIFIPNSIGTFNIIGSKHRLLQFNITYGHKRKTEWLHPVFLILVIENHPVCRQIESATLVAIECWLAKSAKWHCHIVAKQQYPIKNQIIKITYCLSSPAIYTPHGNRASQRRPFLHCL